MRRKRATSSKRNSNVTGPPRKKNRKNVSRNDQCPSDAETVPDDVCHELGSSSHASAHVADDGIPVITVDDSDSSVTSELNVPFTEHEKDNKNCGTPCKYSHKGSICENRKSSAESEVSVPCFEMLFTEERIKTEPLGSSCNSENVSTSGDHLLNPITSVCTQASAGVEKLCSAEFKAKYDEFVTTMLHNNYTSKKSSALEVPVSDKSGKTRILDSEFHNACSPIVSATPHVKVERVEIPDDVKLLEVTKPAADTHDYTSTDLETSKTKNTKNATDFILKNQNCICDHNLVARQRGNTCDSLSTCNGMDDINTASNLLPEQVSKCTKVKSEPSEDKKTSCTVSDTVSTCSTAEDENVLKYEHLCNVTCEIKNIAEPLLPNVSDSQGLSKESFKRAALKTGCNMSAGIAFGNQKSNVCPENLCASSDKCPFNLNTLSLNPTEQKAAEVVGSLPLEKLQILIKEYVERRCLDLEPILQETSKEQSKSCSQNVSTCTTESKHVETVLSDLNTVIKDNFSKISKGETSSEEWQENVNKFIQSSLIKMEDEEVVGLDLRCRLNSTESNITEQNLKVSCSHSCKCNENKKSNENSIPFAKYAPPVSSEENCKILPSSVDEMQQNITPGILDCIAVSTNLCHAVKESSSDLVSANQNSLKKNASSGSGAYTDDYYRKGDEIGECDTTICGTNHGAEADMSSRTNCAFTHTSHSQQNLIKNDLKEKQSQNAGNEMVGDHTCSGNSVNLVPESQQTLLDKDISSVENTEDRHQSSGNLTLKHSCETTEKSNEKNSLSNEVVVASKQSYFHSDVNECHYSEIQVKKELEDNSLLNDIKSIFGSEGEVNSGNINISKILSLEALKAIVNAASSLSDAPSSDVSEASCSEKNCSTKLDETTFASCLKKECSGNFPSTADVLHAISHICSTPVESEHYDEDLSHFKKQELISKPLDLCMKNQEVTGTLKLESSTSAIKCDEICRKPSSHIPQVSECEKQNLSNLESAVHMLQKAPDSVGCGMEGVTTTCGVQNSNISQNSLENDDALDSSFTFKKEENTNSCTILNVLGEEKPVNGKSACNGSDCNCTGIGGDGITMRKRHEHFNSPISGFSKKCKIALNEDIPVSLQENNNLCVDYCNTSGISSGKKNENAIIKDFSALSFKAKQNDDSEAVKKSVDENIKSQSAASLCKNSHVQGNAEVGGKCGPSETIEKNGHDLEITEPEVEIPNSKKVLESIGCATDNNFYAMSLSTKGSNKVQRFASRASFLTNEILDGESKIIHRQQKVFKEKQNEQASDFLSSGECHLLVKTPDININTCDKNFGVCEKRSTTTVFGIDPKRGAETVVKEGLIEPSASNIEGQNIETLINGKQSVVNRDPRRRIEVFVSGYKQRVPNREDSSSLGTNAQLNEENNFHGFAESQNFVQFPSSAGNYNQNYQNMYNTNNSYWNYPNSMHRNRYPGVECFRTPRYPNFPPYQASMSPSFPYYSNGSLPYQPVPRFMPPLSQFGFPLRGYPGMPRRSVSSRANQHRAVGYPPRHSFLGMHSSYLPHCYPSQADFSPTQPEPGTAQSTASPVFHSAVSTDFVPSATSPSNTPAAAACDMNRAYPLETEPVQMEYVSSTVSKSSSGLSHTKVPKVPRRARVRSSEELPSPLCSSPFELDELLLENAVFSPKAVTPERKSSKKSSSIVSNPCTSKNFEPSTVTYDKSRSKLPSKDFLNTVLTWSVNWLTQQLSISYPPPPIASNIKKTMSAYECYNNYYSTYFPFLLLETWEVIFQSWKREKGLNTYFCFLKQYKNCDKGMYEINFETVISESGYSSGKYPAEGYLVIIKFALQGSGSTKIYGYVCSHSFRPFSSSLDSNHPFYSETSNKPAESDRILSLVVKTSWKCENINPETLPCLQVLNFLKPAIKQFDALVKLQYSPLCEALLSPKQTNCRLISLSKGKSCQTNDLDMETITEIGTAILQPDPQVVVVEALPDTNKVNTLVKVINIMKSLETSTVKVKLLFCSQSNEVLDHVGCSLVYSQGDLEEKNKLRCVRMGKLNDIHPDMRNLALHSLVGHYVEALKDQELEECEKDISDIRGEINDTCDKIYTLQKLSAPLAAKLEKTVPDLDKKLQAKLKKKEAIITRHKTQLEQHKNEAQRSILFNADITLTTINDYHQLEILDTSGKTMFIPFRCCILDGANQCSELETLPPLLSEIGKLVLCGDPDVSPVILSKLIEKNDSYLSCFRRVRSLINANDKKKKKK